MSLIIDNTGWLTDWEKTGGRFKEWVRNVSLTSINHGWLYALCIQPVHWWDSVCHIVSWIPILWDDRDWDHVYLLIMMREKLKRMRRLQEEHGSSSNRMKYARDIRVAELLLDRIINCDYTTADYAEHEKKFGRFMDRREELPGGGFVSHTRNDPEASKDIRRMADKETRLSKQDLEYFGAYFAKHVRN